MIATGKRLSQAFRVHPGKHQHIAVGGILRDGGHKAVSVEFDCRKEGVDGKFFVGHYPRVPVKVCVPNMPSFTLPEMVSPLTVPLKASVIGMGRVIDELQDTLSPLTFPSAMGWPSP